MAETSLVSYLMNGMKGRWQHPVKHADAFTSGVADVSAWIDGLATQWIECKVRDGWPKRPNTIVKFDFRDDQKLFLLRRRGFLFCRVAREYLLFGYNDAYHLVEHSSRRELYQIALGRWERQVNWDEFEGVIRREGKTQIDV